METLLKFLSSCSDQELKEYAIKVRAQEYATVSTDPIAYKRWDGIGYQVRKEVNRRASAISSEDLLAMLKSA